MANPAAAQTEGDIYDHMAPHYRAYAEKKSAYMNAVDETILEFLPPNTTTMLDVGAGDGVRGVTLAGKAGITELTLLEPSAEMVKLCQSLPVKNIWHGSADDLPKSHTPPFDLITCLWNVLGHVPDSDARVRALKNMAALLKQGGIIALDVNNRHNANAYGNITVAGRYFIDLIHPDVTRGDVSFDWDIDGQKIPARGHLFTPQEMRAMFREAGLRLTHSFAIDYKSGVRSRNLFMGQMTFILEKEVTK